MRLHSLEQRANEYREKIKGKTSGVSFWRLELESLERAITKLNAHRRRMRENINSRNACGRNQAQAKRITDRLALLSQCWVERGRAGELNFLTPLDNVLHSPDSLEEAIIKYPNHPNARRFAARGRAHQACKRALDLHLIPMPIINMKIKLKRWPVEYDLYAYSDTKPLVIVRVGYPTSDKPTARINHLYFALNATKAADITHRKDEIKEGIREDPAPDGPLKAIFAY